MRARASASKSRSLIGSGNAPRAGNYTDWRRVMREVAYCFVNVSVPESVVGLGQLKLVNVPDMTVARLACVVGV